jgi:hypothetical protein
MAITPTRIEDLQPLLEQLTSPDNQKKIAAAGKIMRMGVQAASASQHLWGAFDMESEKPENQVRIWMLRDILAVTKRMLYVVYKFKERLQRPGYSKLAAVEALAQVGPDALDALPTLFELLKDREFGIQEALSRALLAIETDKARLIDGIQPILKEPVLYVFPFFDQIARSRPSESDRQRLLGDLWQALETNADPPSIADLLASIFRLSRDYMEFFDQLVENQKVPGSKKSLVFAIPYSFLDARYALQRWWDKDPERVLNLVLVGLQDQYASYPTAEFLLHFSQSIGAKEQEKKYYCQHWRTVS